MSLTLAPEAAHASVPVLVVQPLVENALKHGLTPRVQAGTLAVRASVRDGRIRIEVEDDGVGLPEGWTMAASRGTACAIWPRASRRSSAIRPRWP